jgi:hypothetical protein
MIGNTEKTIENLNKLMDLDPDNAYAQKKLEEINKKK